MDKDRRKKKCYFSENKIAEINYKDAVLLRRFLTDRGKILSGRITGVRAPFQRKLAKAIKRARQAGLLPYILSGD